MEEESWFTMKVKMVLKCMRAGSNMAKETVEAELFGLVVTCMKENIKITVSQAKALITRITAINT